MQKVEHPFIMKTFEYLEDESYFYIINEYNIIYFFIIFKLNLFLKNLQRKINLKKLKKILKNKFFILLFY